MANISPNHLSLDSLALVPPAHSSSAPEPASTQLSAQENSNLPKPTAGQGASRHPLQSATPSLYLSLPRELRDQITAHLDVADKLNLKLTCRQTHAEGKDFHFDISIPTGEKLDQALAFFKQCEGRLDSMSIEAKGTPDNYQRSIQMLAQRYAHVPFEVERPRLTNLVTVRLAQFAQLRDPSFKSLKHLELVGCHFSDKDVDVHAQAVAILSGLKLGHLRLVNNDWLTKAHLEQLYEGGVRSFSLVGNKRLTPADITQFESKEDVQMDVDADAKELAARQGRSGSVEFDRAYANPDTRLGIQLHARGLGFAMSLV